MRTFTSCLIRCIDWSQQEIHRTHHRTQPRCHQNGRLGDRSGAQQGSGEGGGPHHRAEEHSRKTSPPNPRLIQSRYLKPLLKETVQSLKPSVIPGVGPLQRERASRCGLGLRGNAPCRLALSAPTAMLRSRLATLHNGGRASRRLRLLAISRSARARAACHAPYSLLLNFFHKSAGAHQIDIAPIPLITPIGRGNGPAIVAPYFQEC